MKDKLPEFRCTKCGQSGIHYCRGMCNPCYQRHLRQKHRDRKTQSNNNCPIKKSKNNYPFRSSRVGDQFQSSIPASTRPAQELKFSKIYNFNDEEKIEQFLKFCKLVFTDYQIDGDIIKGGCGVEERALKLLEKYGDVYKAMYAVLKPVSLMFNPELIHNLPYEEIVKEVDDATKELTRVKVDGKEDFLDKMKKSVADGISEQELQTLLQIATNMKAKVPGEIADELSEAEVFSQGARKRLKEKLLSVGELQELVQESEAYKIQTSTMKSMKEYLTRAQEWTAKVKELNYPTLKQLHSLVTEGSALPINLPELPSVKEKHRKTKKWIESAHNLIRSWKARKENSRTSVQEVMCLLNEAKELKFTHHEIGVLENSIEQVKEWQERVKMSEEDKESDSMMAVLEEGNNLPLEVGSLEGIKNNAQWSLRARKILETQVINQKQLTQLINEAKGKKISSQLFKELQSMLKKFKEWREKSKRVLAGSEVIEISKLEKLCKQGESQRIEVEPTLSELNEKLSNALEFQQKCIDLANMDQEKWTWEQVKEILSQNDNLKVSCHEYKSIKNKVKAIDNWVNEAADFLKKVSKQRPSINDVPSLTRLLQSCPDILKESPEFQELTRLELTQQEWAKEIPVVVKDNPAEQLMSLSDRNFRAPFLSKQTEEWREKLHTACEEGVIDKLIDLYKESKNIPVPETQKTLLKRSLIEICAWKERARDIINNGGEYAELKTLMKEGDLICYETDEFNQLAKIAEDLKGWRLRARKVLSALPNPPPRTPINPRSLKKRCTLEEYIKEQEEAAAQESPVDIDIPYNFYAFPLYHPTEGISMIFRINKIFPKIKPRNLIDFKRKRALNFKSRLNDEVKQTKKSSKRPKDFTVPWSTFCVCNYELNWDDTVMVNCDSCGEWYHPSCIGLDAGEIDKIEEFICFLCNERTGSRNEKTRRQVISTEDFVKLLEEGEKFKINGDERRELKLVYEKMQAWKGSINELFDAGLQAKKLKMLMLQENQILENEQTLFDCKVMRKLADYEGLPVVIPERELLMKLLQKRDWLRDAYKSLYVKISLRNMKKLIADSQNWSEPEIVEVVKKLEEMINKASEYTQKLQDLETQKVSVKMLKNFIDGEDPHYLKIEKVDRLKKRIELFEALINDIQKELNTSRDYAKLNDLRKKAQKMTFTDPVLDELNKLLFSVDQWIQTANTTLENDQPGSQYLKDLLQEYQVLNVIHPLSQLIEEKLNQKK